MEIDLTTPALLFPAISLLLLAYTNRFLVLADLVRKLHSQHKESPNENLSGQILNLRKRLRMIRDMQVLGVSSFFLCVLTMYMIFKDRPIGANVVFSLALILLMGSLAISVREVYISIHALNLQLTDCEED